MSSHYGDFKISRISPAKRIPAPLVLLAAAILIFSLAPAASHAESVKKAFVSCMNSDSVWVVDPSGVNESTQVDVNSKPVDLAVDAGGEYAYVLNKDSGDISVLDIAGNSLSKTINLRSGYQPIRVSTDGERNYAYVTAALDGYPSDCIISVINMNTRMESAVIETERYNEGSGSVRATTVVYYSGTPYMLITHYYDNQLVVYNLNTYTKVGVAYISHEYTLGQVYPVLNATDIAVMNVSGVELAYIAHDKNVSLFPVGHLISAASTGSAYTADRTINTGTVAGSINRIEPDEQRQLLYMSCNSKSIAIADWALYGLVGNVPVGNPGNDPGAMTLDNATLYVCDSDKYVSTVDVDRMVETGQISVGSMPSGIAIRTVDVPTPTVTPTPTPLPQPVVNVSVSPNPLVAGSDAVVRVTVMNGTAPLKSSNVRITSTGDGILRSPIGATTSDGVYVSNFTATAAGRYDLAVTANTSGYQDQSAAAVVYVNAAPAKRLSINITIEPREVTVGSEASIVVKVTDNGTPVGDAAISFDSTGGRVTRLMSTTTSDGACQAKYTSNASGSFVLTVTANKTDYSLEITKAIITVLPATLNVLTLNVTVVPQPVILGNETVITVTVLNGSAPVNGALVELSSSFGAITPLSGLTTSDGRFLARLKPSSTGFGFITASANATGFERATSSTAVEAAAAAAKKLYINMSIAPNPVDAKDGATVVISVTDGVSPLSDARINVTCTGGNIVPAYGKTDSAGKYNAKFIPDGVGTYTIAAVAMATGFEQASSNAMVDATESLAWSDYVLWIALLVIIVIIIILALVWFLRKWLRKTLVLVPRKTRIPADGTTKVPIRVQFVNGFGMARRMGSSLDVDLEATAGTIKGATLSSGREYVDADLTSSREFGPVMVTAKSGRDVATATVQFVVDDGALDVTITPDSIPADGKSSASITVKVKDAKGNEVKPLEDTAIDFTTSLGDAVSSVVMPAGDAAATATIFSGDMTGISVVNASMGNLRGEAKIEFRGLPKRFCMNCGAPMSLDAQSCPACGKNPPSGVDTKQCMTCGTVIPEQALFCHKCGSMQSARAKVPPAGGAV